MKASFFAREPILSRPYNLSKSQYDMRLAKFYVFCGIDRFFIAECELNF